MPEKSLEEVECIATETGESLEEMDTEHLRKTKTEDTQNSKTKETHAESGAGSKKYDDGAYSRKLGNVDTPYNDNTGRKEGASKEASKKGKRTVYMMRHAERVDRVFPGWTKLAFVEEKGYRPYDLNQPLSLPQRMGTPNSYADDTPITETGYVTAQIVGRGMRVTKVRFQAIYTSPVLRCIQTGLGLLKTLKIKDMMLKVEPGLVNWMGWYPKSYNWLSSVELSDAKFAIDNEYKPVMTEEEVGMRRSESSEGHYSRIAEVCRKILQRHTDGAVLIIGHGTTVDAGTRSLLGRQTTDLSKDTLDKIGTHYPYCCVQGLQETDEEDQWKVIHNALPPISFHDSNNRINYDFFNRIG